MTHSRIIQAFRVLVWSSFFQEKGRTLLTILGVSLGVAILIAIDLTSGTAVSQFDRNIRQIAGNSTLTARSNAVPLDTRLVWQIEKHPDVLIASPLIQGYVSVEDSESEILLLGLDLLKANGAEGTAVRDFDLELQEGIEYFDLFSNRDYALVPNRLLTKYSLSLGDSLPLMIDDQSRPMIIVGVIKGDGVDLIRDGEFLVTDIAVADYLLSRDGKIDQIDLITAPDADLQKIKRDLQLEIPASVILEEPEQRGNNVNQMIGAFRFNLKALGHLSLLVGAFLIYNTMNISVLRRRQSIGTLRAMGISRTSIRLIFLAEGFVFGLFGGFLGIILGTLMSAAMLDLVTEAISINFFESNAHSLILVPSDYLQALALGIFFSTFAAIGPANEAATTPPANTILSGHSIITRRARILFISFSILSFIFTGWILSRPIISGIPWVGYSASILILIGCLFLTRSFLSAFLYLLKPLVSKVFRAEGILGISSIQGSINRSSIALAGLFLSVAMSISVSVMIASFRETVIVWMNQVLKADLYIVAGPTIQSDPTLPRELEAILVNIEGVEIVEPFQKQEFEYNGSRAFLAGGRFNQDRFAQNMIDSTWTVEKLTDAKNQNQVIISEAFARKHRLEAGDQIELPSASGNFSPTIAGLYYDYSSEQGYVVMDRMLFERVYGQQPFDSLSLFVEEGVEPNAVRQRVIDKLATLDFDQQIDINLSGELRSFALGQFDKTFAITYAMQFIAVIVAVLGIVTTLLAQIIDRKKDLQTLRTIGASSKRVARLILVESSLISLAGILLGIIVGLVLSYILTTVIMLQSFGWTINFTVPIFIIVQIAIIIFIATMIGSVFPARKAARS